MADIFISYSRKDKEFVRVLHDALSQSKYDTWVDWQDIPLTADWWQEIERGIEGANAFLCVISPDSVASSVCRDEVDHAVKHNKRLVPIVRRDGFEVQQVHPALSRHNWLFFRESDDFETAFQSLITAIDLDLEHVRTHTRLLVRAIEWESHGRNDSFLLRGSDLADAERWLNQGDAKEPKPTEQQRNYIHKSRDAENAIRRLQHMVGVGAGVMGVMLAVAAIAGVRAHQQIQTAAQQVADAKAEVQASRQERDRLAQQVTEAQRGLASAERKQQDATAKTRQAEQKQATAQRQARTALQQSRTAQTQAKQAQQAQVVARHQLQASLSRLALAQQDVVRKTQEVAQRTAELTTSGQRLSALNIEFSQTRNQLNYIQRDLAEAIQNSLTRTEQQTGQRSAVIYASFVPVGSPENANAAQVPTAASTSQDASTPNSRPRQDSDQLGLWLVTEGSQQPILVREANRVAVQAASQQLRRMVSDIRRSRIQDAGYRQPAQQLYNWIIKPLEPELRRQRITNLVLLMDASLRSLPFAALQDGQQFLIEKYSFGLMPSLALTDPRYVDLRNAPVLAVGASEFQELPPIPLIPFELSSILHVRQGEELLNQQFTLDNLRQQRQQRSLPIVHIATQGDFRPDHPEDSFIQLWDRKLRPNQIDQLSLYSPPVELLVLSSCRTALGDESLRFGFAGAAIQNGAKSVLSSLWYVSDLGTTALMLEFYQQLHTAPIRAEALRRSQLAMMRGDVRIENEQLVLSNGQRLSLPALGYTVENQTFVHPYDWASFTMIGNPW
ncbi:MAG TPA: CHAT domain-containing protein [Crinalium sp.]